MGSGTSIKARENITKVYGHLEVIRVGTKDGLTAIRVKRNSWG